MRKPGILVLLLLSAALAAHADTTVFTETWEGYTPGEYDGVGDPPLGPWQLNGGTIDVLGTTWFGELCSAAGLAGQCVDIAGVSPGSIINSTPINLVAGNQYTIGFELAGNQRANPESNTVAVFFGGNFYLYTVAKEQGAQTYTIVYIAGADGSTTLGFASQDLNEALTNGALLGNISVTESATPVPEPASLALLGTGLVSLGGFFRKKIFG